MNKQITDSIADAIFSDDRKYRYVLWRVWDKSKPKVMFIGLNPSTANETQPDNTITKVCKIAKNNGYGGVYMVNCWAYVATKPEDLKFSTICDQYNNKLIAVVASHCQDVVFAWGNFKIVVEHNRDKELSEMFPNAKALVINKNGSPKHPLYCKDDSVLIQFTKR